MLEAIIVGLVAGMLAKAIMPGSSNEPSGWILTILLGIVGAFVGRFLLGAIFGLQAGNILMSIVFATVGAIAVIALMRLFMGRRAV